VVSAPGLLEIFFAAPADIGTTKISHHVLEREGMLGTLCES
jgi:hypothetical protein